MRGGRFVEIQMRGGPRCGRGSQDGINLLWLIVEDVGSLYLLIVFTAPITHFAVREVLNAVQTEAAGRVSLGGKLTFEVEELMGRELGV